MQTILKMKEANILTNLFYFSHEQLDPTEAFPLRLKLTVGSVENMPHSMYQYLSSGLLVQVDPTVIADCEDWAICYDTQIGFQMTGWRLLSKFKRSRCR